MQRLFSTFANGWPGVGLLFLRLLTGTALIYFSIAAVPEEPSRVIFQIVGLTCGVALLAGFYTPVAGAIAAVAKVWIAIRQCPSHSDDAWISIAQAILAAALAMTGPGAWSIDARRFGRKHIDFSDR